MVFTLESLFAGSVCQISAQSQHHLPNSNDIFHPFRQGVRTFPPCCTQLLLLCFLQGVRMCPWRPALYWRQACEAAWGSLVLLLSLSKVQDVPPRAALPQHTGSLHTGSFLGREGSTANGEWEEMKWDEKRGVCFSSPNCLNRKAVQRGPRCGEGNQGEPSDRVGRTEMVENRTWK